MGDFTVVLIGISLMSSGGGITILTPRLSTKRRCGFSNMTSGFILQDKYYYGPRVQNTTRNKTHSYYVILTDERLEAATSLITNILLRLSERVQMPASFPPGPSGRRLTQKSRGVWISMTKASILVVCGDLLG